MPIRVNPDETFHVLFGQNVREMDLDALDLAYRADAIEDETLIWQEGLGEWLRLDVVLARLAEQESNENAQYSLPAPAPADDVYFVLLGPDDTKQMSLDQLDDAYRLDVIDEATLVWQPGFSEWIRLDQLLALTEQEAPVPHASIYPSATPTSVAPRSAAPQSYGYVIGRPADSTAPLTHSLAPAFQLDELDEYAPRPASAWYRRGLVAAVAAVALLGAHQAGVTRALLGGTRLASAMGEPSVDTPHGLTRWLGKLEQENGLDQLSHTEPMKAAASPASAETPAKATMEPATMQPAPAHPAPGSQAEPSSEPAVAAAALNPALPVEPAPAQPAAESLPLGAASRFSNTLQGKKPIGATARPAARPASKSTKTTHSKGSSLAYDPMNGTL
jgi:hypothetical protein